MRITVVVIGRPRHSALAAAIDDYEKRAARYWTLEVKEIREAKGTNGAQVRRREGERLVQTLAGRPFIACAESGKRLDSAGFASLLRGSRDTARDATFVIGGAFGLDQTVTGFAALTMSLAPWTLSHELARLVLAEQLYRAGTILRGEPYHK